jgi:two-component system, NarL family, nitrate/nitrite response regulator NarL
MNTTVKIRILLIDELPIVRTGLRMLIESHGTFEVIGEADTLIEALPLMADAPDIILLDLNSLSYQTSLESIPQAFNLAFNGSQPRLLLLTDADDPEVNLNAIKMGAMGIVNKKESADVLIKAIERINAGEVWINRAIMERVMGGIWNSNHTQTVVADPEAVKIGSVTRREHEVIQLIGQGLKNKQIAESLYISEITVRHHLTSIFDKLGVSDRFELAIYSYRHGLAKLPI